MDPRAVVGALRTRDRWRVDHVLETTSTNDDLARGSKSGAYAAKEANGAVLVTEEQTAGRGRSGRQWSCPPGAGLMFSVKVATDRIPPTRRAWVGVALGLAIVGGFREIAVVEAGLKWPNDVLVGGLKCGGILAEAIGESVVVGAGLNISLQRNELPRVDATSLLLAGGVSAGAAPVDRNRLLAAILDEFGDLLERWRESGGDVDAGGLRSAYLAACTTIGSSVRLELPGDSAVTGRAVDVDVNGAIVLERPDGRRSSYSAGDVVHLRPGTSVAGG